MQFITNGPDVPDSLLEAHEEGRVIFFCGAGVSYPAGLPGFQRLVADIRDELGAHFSDSEQRLFDEYQYDRTLDSMERRLAAGRIGMRKALAKVLTTDFSKPEATQTHAALLQLAKDAKGVRRLVTTNFDRGFQHVIARDGIQIDSNPAPMLPVPKPSRWDGIAYLHGFLSEPQTDATLHRLIVTSGDFGQAYLTERWAARFVSELFRNFVVCFVGYSINDPILRYMMDALAADRLQGETTQRAYAFGDFKDGKFAEADNEWRAKGVEPILYQAKQGDGHANLHKTLIEWANMHRDGALGKEAIISRFAGFPPQQSTKEDDYVGRVVWAICDPTGMPARRFAELVPAPPLSWLEPLIAARFSSSDASRFDISALALNQELHTFSVLSRPSPARLGTPMRLAYHGGISASARLDDVTFQLARWLLRHLDDARLVIWLAEQGGQLHPVWASTIEHHLSSMARLAKADAAAYERILADSPGTVPSALLRPFWDALLTGLVQSRGEGDNFYGWVQIFNEQGMTWFAKRQLLRYLNPRVRLYKPYGIEAPVGTARRRKELVGWELTISGGYVAHALKEFKAKPNWRACLPALLPDFANLLGDALDVSSLLRDDDGYELPSNYVRSCIAEHDQNNDFDEWTVLIDLVRDSWLEAFKEDPDRAGAVASAWWASKHHLFKRVALFAAGYPTAIAPSTAFSWLLSQEGKWLWGDEARTEVMPWLATAADQLDEDGAATLQRKILEGPPAILTEGHPNPTAIKEHFEEIELLALLNLTAGGTKLLPDVQARRDQLQSTYPDVHLSENHRENFSSWTTSGFGNMSAFREHITLPQTLPELVEALRSDSPDDFWHTDDWRTICRENVRLASGALLTLAKEGTWPRGRWRTALYEWANPEPNSESWSVAGPTVLDMPDAEFLEIRHAIADWIRSLSKAVPSHVDVFFNLCFKVIRSCPEDAPSAEKRCVDDAINHPIGKVTDAVIRWWFSTEPKDDQQLPQRVSELLSVVMKGAKANLIHGRILIASHAASLFRADPSWVRGNFIGRLDWNGDAEEAACLWEGFLWSPRGTRALITEIKPYLLETANHYQELGNHANQYVGFLADVGLEARDLFQREELVACLASLPQAGLEHAALMLAQHVARADDPTAYWCNRVKPFVHETWPRDGVKRSEPISNAFARLCVLSGDAIASALAELKIWLMPAQHPGMVYHELKEGDLAARHPSEVLELLDAVTANNALWLANDLQACLAKIESGDASLKSGAAFKRLEEIVRRSPM